MLCLALTKCVDCFWCKNNASVVLQTQILYYEFFHLFFLIQKNFLQPIVLTECPAMILNKIEKKLTRPIQDERF